MRDTFVKTLCNMAMEDENIYLLSGDLGFGVLDKFWNTYPDRFINMGICEQNMASVAAGMGLEGKNVFTYSIANFPTLRCIEQIRNDIAYHKANVKVVAVGGGFAYGALGMSHHATEDIAILRALPEMTVFTPCDPMETKVVTRLAARMDTPCYIRLGRGGEKNLHQEEIDFAIGTSNILREGSDIAILVAGAIASEAVSVSDMLKKYNISCAVYSFPTVKPIDQECIVDVANKVDIIFTLEEHNIIGGLGSAVSEVVAGRKTRACVVRLGLNDEYTSKVGSQQYLRKAYGIDALSINKRILSELGKMVY